MKFHILGGLNTINVFSHSSEGLDSRLKVVAFWFPLPSLPLTRRPPNPVTSHGLSSLFHGLGASLWAQICSFKDTSRLG